MARTKESLIFIINVGISSKESQDNGLLLDKAKIISQRIIEKKIFYRPEDEIGIILTGTNTTQNKLGFKNIQTYGIQVPTWELIKTISNLKHINCLSNWIEALYVANDYIKHECIGGVKTVILISDFEEVPDLQQFSINDILKKLQKQSIQLLAIGSESLLEKSQSSVTPSEKFFLDLCKEVNGTYRTIDKALDDLCFITKTESKPRETPFTLEILDLNIPIKSYIKVNTETRFPTWKFATDTNLQNETIQPKYPVKVERITELSDRHRETCQSAETACGYIYGDVFVKFGDEDEKAMSYKSGPSSYKFITTAKKENVAIQYWCSSSSYIIFPDNETVAPQFYSLLQAMNEENIVGIFRKVGKKDSVPNIVALFPHINIPDEPWCFVEVKLPFAEDVRIMDSKSLISNIEQLSYEQNEIIDNFLDSFLSTNINDASEEKKKEFMPGCILNPMIQHTYNMLSYRALNPEKPLPSIDPKVKQLLEPCKLIKEKSEIFAQKMKSLFDINNDPASEVIISKNSKEEATEVQSLHISKIDDSFTDNENSEEPVLSLDVLDIDMDQLMDNI